MRISPLLRTKQYKGQTSVVINLPRALFLKSQTGGVGVSRQSRAILPNCSKCELDWI